MSQDDSYPSGLNQEANDPRVNHYWPQPVSCSDGLDVILKPGNKKLFEALRSYVDLALQKRWPELVAEDRDELFIDAVIKLHGMRHLVAQFAYLFGKNRKEQPGPLGAYVAIVAKNIYRSNLRRAERAARHEEELIERQKRLEQMPSPLEVLMARANLDAFREKLGKLFAAGRGIIHRRHWNALLEFLSARWPVELGELLALWPGIEPANNRATRRSDRFRARAELARLTPEYCFTEDEIALLRALRVIL